jgi:hypothetical protein
LTSAQAANPFLGQSGVTRTARYTSDTHHWFGASRLDPTGLFGDYYEWCDTDTEYAGVRVIFSDTEPSNRTSDPVRQHTTDDSIETVPCVHNLSERLRGGSSVELTGGTAFPNVNERPYLLTLSGYGSYWCTVIPARQPVPSPRAEPAAGSSANGGNRENGYLKNGHMAYSVLGS